MILNAMSGYVSANNNVYNNTFWNVTSYAMTAASSGAATNNNTWNNLSNDNSWAGTNITRNLSTSTDQFVNSAANNYQLKSGVTAINYGTTVGGLPSVADGKPDAGAFEYGETAWTAGASFKTWTFANQVDAPLTTALYVAQTAPTTAVTTGSLWWATPRARPTATTARF